MLHITHWEWGWFEFFPKEGLSNRQKKSRLFKSTLAKYLDSQYLLGLHVTTAWKFKATVKRSVCEDFHLKVIDRSAETHKACASNTFWSLRTDVYGSTSWEATIKSNRTLLRTISPRWAGRSWKLQKRTRSLTTTRRQAANCSLFFGRKNSQSDAVFYSPSCQPCCIIS